MTVRTDRQTDRQMAFQLYIVDSSTYICSYVCIASTECIHGSTGFVHVTTGYIIFIITSGLQIQSIQLAYKLTTFC